MSDAYIRSLTQKYRLAVAIAVLKDKPQDVSLEKYIGDLRNKINNENMDDLELTVCSDDFDMEENAKATEVYTEINIEDIQTKNDTRNSETILKGYNIEISNNCMEIREGRSHVRQEISISTSTVDTHNLNLDLQARTQETVNLTQIEMSQDLESTFCETQYSESNVFNNNELQNSNNDTIFKLNEATQPNEVHLNVLNEVGEINNSDHTFYDSQATELYSLHGYTQNYTHVSQSQNYDQFVVNDKFLKAKNNIQPYTTTNLSIKEASTIPCNVASDVNTIQLSQINKETNSQHKTTANENNTLTNQLNESSYGTNENAIESQFSVAINETFPQYAQDLNELEICDTNKVAKETNGNKYNEEINEVDENSSNESQIVSFKVVEELNKVKNYINKKVERRLSNDGSIDSGYRTDSQSKCSFRSSLQLSGNWLNQSAHSLYEYITQCPLLATTHEIIGEIAQVLGQLIDKLHEEEKYPSFLNDLLENVNVLLQELLQESGGEDVLLTKDETVQRLLLLNKSIHIQKYTIEKITSILENMLTHLTNTEETYEISNISEMENISYIFHLLEIILQRYIKGKNVVSQEMTNSQIELKKSSITELWRKKWNPNYKEDFIEEYTPRKCVLIKCNEVLNKLVVSCMDGYSLVAFAALNSFNMLQS